MAYRFMNKKIAPAPVAMDTKSLAAFPALGSGSGSLRPPTTGEKKVQMPVKLDYKKTVIVTPPTLTEIEKMAASSKAKEVVKPSSTIPTHCYDEFGEDYDGPDEWEMERAAEEHEVNASLPVGGRRGGF
jgi:hypothetical protein